MIINDKCKSIIPFKHLNNIYVVADFDRTLTAGTSSTSWFILSKIKSIPKTYVQERQELYDYYRPIEVDDKIDYAYKMEKMIEWYHKHISLFVKYKLTQETFDKAVTDAEVVKFRPGAKEFMKFLNDNNIPLIIISAGVGNVIEAFLNYNNCYYDNIYVVSNMITFENGVASGVASNIVHNFNKNEVVLPEPFKERLKNRTGVLLLGDQVSDLNMVDKSIHEFVVTAGFHVEDYPAEEMIANYDIYCEKGEGYDDLKKVLF